MYRKKINLIQLVLLSINTVRPGVCREKKPNLSKIYCFIKQKTVHLCICIEKNQVNLNLTVL